MAYDGMPVLELRTSSNQSLAGFVAGELGEVLDEAAGEVLGLLVPLSSVSVGIARVKDLRVYSRKLRRNDEVEVRDGLRGSLVD